MSRDTRGRGWGVKSVQQIYKVDLLFLPCGFPELLYVYVSSKCMIFFVNLDKCPFRQSKITLVGSNFGPSKSTVVERNFGPSKIKVLDSSFGPSNV